MSKKNVESIGQGMLFDDGLQPVIDYGTTAKDIDEIFTAIREIAPNREIGSSQTPIVKSGKYIVVGKEIEELNIYLKKNLAEVQIKQALTNTFKKILKNRFPQVKYHEGWLGFNGRETWKGAFTQHAPEEWIGLIQDRINGRDPMTEERMLREIQNIKDMGVNNIESIFGFFPFYFLNGNFVDYKMTIKNFDLQDNIEGYKKMLREQESDERYKRLIPAVEKYLKFFHSRDGKQDSLSQYKDITSKIPEFCRNKIIIGIDGGLNLYAMLIKFGLDTTTNMVNKIIKEEPPYNDSILRNSLTLFFEKQLLIDNLNVFEKNKEKLVTFFQEIAHHIDQNQYGIDNIRSFYKTLFNDLVEANHFFKQNTDFDALRDDYLVWTERSYNEEYKILVQNIVETLSATNLIEDTEKIEHKVAMFGSYKKLNNANNIETIYKTHLVKNYLYYTSKKISN